MKKRTITEAQLTAIVENAINKRINKLLKESQFEGPDYIKEKAAEVKQKLRELCKSIIDDESFKTMNYERNGLGNKTIIERFNQISKSIDDLYTIYYRLSGEESLAQERAAMKQEKDPFGFDMPDTSILTK